MRIADWITLVVTGLPALAAAVVSIIVAIRTHPLPAQLAAVHQELRPPSNGRTLGEVAEGAWVLAGAAASDAAKVRSKLVSGPPVPDTVAVPPPTPGTPTLPAP